MASEEKKYIAKLKKEVARKALDKSKRNLDELSEQYDVPVSVILMWATELEKKGPDAFESSAETPEDTAEIKGEEVSVEISDDDIARSVEYGAMFDDLNYKRLVFWSVLGTLLVVIFVQALIEMYQYNVQITQERVSAESEFYQVNRLKDEAREKLNSFGIVDGENNIYRIPIDSAINEIAADQND